MDATEILAKFQNYDFGAVEIDQLHLSQRRAARDAILYGAFLNQLTVSINSSAKAAKVIVYLQEVSHLLHEIMDI